MDTTDPHYQIATKNEYQQYPGCDCVKYGVLLNCVYRRR